MKVLFDTLNFTLTTLPPCFHVEKNRDEAQKWSSLVAGNEINSCDKRSNANEKCQTNQKTES